MLSKARRAALLSFAVLCAAGCEPPAASLAPSLGGAADAIIAGLEAAPIKQRGQGGGKQKRFGDAPVFVDGELQGMLRFSELPPSLPTIRETLEGGKVVRRFAWTQYFAALGVDLSQIAAVHFYGGRDLICVVEGDELRRVGDSFRFSFTRATSGFPRLEPPEDGIRYNTYVDKLRAVAVYVKKPAPSYDDLEGLRLPDGTKVEKGFPYAAGERHGGTRIYLDGKLVNVFHRRALDPEAQKESGYELGPALRALGADLATVRRIELISGREEGVSAIEHAAVGEITFDVPRGSGGRIHVGAPIDDDVEAILLYAQSVPADRRLPVHPDGSGQIQIDAGKSNDSAKPVAAHRMQ
jgi:hypothetical protein